MKKLLPILFLLLLPSCNALGIDFRPWEGPTIEDRARAQHAILMKQRAAEGQPVVSFKEWSKPDPYAFNYFEGAIVFDVYNPRR